MKSIRLITRADDAGLNRTVNKAIRSSVKQGIVRNISVLAPAPETAHAAECFENLENEVDFGLQVCLTAEWENVRWGPVAGAAEVPTLLRDDGTLPFTVAELERRKPASEQVLIELKAQHEKLLALGFTLKYVNANQDLERIPGVREGLAAFANKYNLIYTGLLGDDVELLPGWPGPGEHPGTELADHLATVKDGTYLLAGCPAFKTEEIEFLKRPGHPRGEVLLSRNRQRRMFADIEIVDYCENVGIELVRYSSYKR